MNVFCFFLFRIFARFRYRDSFKSRYIKTTFKLLFFAVVDLLKQKRIPARERESSRAKQDMVTYCSLWTAKKKREKRLCKFLVIKFSLLAREPQKKNLETSKRTFFVHRRFRDFLEISREMFRACAYPLQRWMVNDPMLLLCSAQTTEYNEIF